MYKRVFAFSIFFYILFSFFLNTHIFAANTCSSPNFCTQDPCSDFGGSASYSCPFSGQHCCKPLNNPTATPTKPSISKCEQQGGACIGSGACDPRASHSTIDNTCFPNGQGHICCLPNPPAPIPTQTSRTIQIQPQDYAPVQSTISKLCIYNSNPQECETSSTPKCIQITGANMTNVPVNKKFGESIYDINSTITVSCKNPEGATVVYPIPENAVFIKASGNYISKPQANNPTEINWFLDPSAQVKNSSGNYVFNVTIETSNEGFIKTYADLINYQESSNTTTNNPEPNDNTCNNHYNLNKNPLHKNFGDPNCEFVINPAAAKDKLLTLLKQKQLDPEHAELWSQFPRIESSYNPNAWASPATGTPDSVGAWGLFQMGRGKNGQYDHGDVFWQNQTINAVSHIRHGNFNSCDYFQAARDLRRIGGCFTVKAQ